MNLRPPEIPPRRSPRRQTIAELHELQRLAFDMIRRPLTPAMRTRKTWLDGQPTKQVAESIVKPNDRLTALERIEIYSRSYWFRVLDCLWDDYPGLRAIIGERKFEKLRIAYLDQYPSSSFTLRNLGSRMERFISDNPRLVAPHRQMCLDMARFEWAQVVAFDGPALPPLGLQDLAVDNPSALRVRLQPHVTLLEMEYPLDDFMIAVKANLRSESSQASNSLVEATVHKAPKKVRLPGPGRICVAVHRRDNDLYYLRLDAVGYAMLCALRDGKTIGRASAIALAACEAEEATSRQRNTRRKPQTRNADPLTRIQQLFARWSELGWLCKR